MLGKMRTSNMGKKIGIKRSKTASVKRWHPRTYEQPGSVKRSRMAS